MILLAIALSLTIPPAVKTLAVIGVVYGILQAAKKIPILTQYLTGWWAVAFNLVLSILGQLIVIPADQLYTSNTLNIILQVVFTVLSAAGIHGTVKSMSAPQVLATTPPSDQVKEVPAVLVPVDPAAVVVPSNQTVPSATKE